MDHPAPCHVHKGRHYYLPEGAEQPHYKTHRKPSAVEALHKSAAASSVPVKPMQVPSKATCVIANGTFKPAPAAVSGSNKGESRHQKRNISLKKQSGEAVKKSRPGHGVSDAIAGSQIDTNAGPAIENNVAPIALLDKQTSPTPLPRDRRVASNESRQKGSTEVPLQTVMAVPRLPTHVKRASASGFSNPNPIPSPIENIAAQHGRPNTASGQPC